MTADPFCTGWLRGAVRIAPAPDRGSGRRLRQSRCEPLPCNAIDDFRGCGQNLRDESQPTRSNPEAILRR
jgi:hypothetical protein